MEISQNPEPISIFEEFEPQLVLASQGKRFLNYLIDVILFRVIITILVFTIGSFSYYIFAFFNYNTILFQIFDWIFSLTLYALFMGTVEALSKGKSLGKLITGTRAVNEDGSDISATTAFKRGFSRAVPFCAFSALGNPPYPWQDRWTKTYVINEKFSRIDPI